MKSGVIFLKQLGDFVLMQPALARLAGGDDGRVALATKPSFEVLYPLLAGMEAVPLARAGHVADLYVYEHGSKASWLAGTSRASRRHLLLALPERRRWYHGLLYSDIRVDPLHGEYRAAYYHRNTPPGGDEGFAPPRLLPPPVEWRHPRHPCGEYVVVHPTSAWKRKCWTVEGWVEVIRSLHGAGAGTLLLTSGPAEWEVDYCRQLESALPFPVVNLAGDTSLEQYAALLSDSGLTVSVDGSAGHLAAAFGRPGVVLFGPSHPAEWFHPRAGSASLVARNYTDDPDPRASVIPVADVVAKSLECWRLR